MDVNIVIALLDAAHAHHSAAHNWFAREGRGSFATCPVTQNGALRIMGNPRYPKSPGTPARVAPSLVTLTSQQGHLFWHDQTSLLDTTRVSTVDLLNWAQVTDLHLLALAVFHGGKLATFDRKIRPQAVTGGPEALYLID